MKEQSENGTCLTMFGPALGFIVELWKSETSCVTEDTGLQAERRILGETSSAAET